MTDIIPASNYYNFKSYWLDVVLAAVMSRYRATMLWCHICDSPLIVHIINDIDLDILNYESTFADIMGYSSQHLIMMVIFHTRWQSSHKINETHIKTTIIHGDKRDTTKPTIIHVWDASFHISKWGIIDI